MTNPAKVPESEHARLQNDYGADYWVRKPEAEYRVSGFYIFLSLDSSTNTLSVRLLDEACLLVYRIPSIIMLRVAGHDASLRILSLGFWGPCGVGMFLFLFCLSLDEDELTGY